jgi:hypothetical protein
MIDYNEFISQNDNSLYIKNLPRGIRKIPCIPKDVNILHCSNLYDVRFIEDLPDNITEIYLQSCRVLEEFPNPLPRNLKVLECQNCSGLTQNCYQIGLFASHSIGMKYLPEIIPDTLNILVIKDCHAFKELKCSEPLSNLKKLIVTNCILDELPTNFSDLFSDLEILEIRSCKRLTKIPNLPKTLQFIDLSNCQGIKYLPDNFQELSNLKSLKLTNCINLQELPHQFPDSISHFDIDFCSSLINLPNNLPNNLDSIGNSQNFISLNTCPLIKHIPNIIPSKIIGFHIQNCNNLLSIMNNQSNDTIKTFKAYNCPKLNNISLFPNLKCLVINNANLHPQYNYKFKLTQFVLISSKINEDGEHNAIAWLKQINPKTLKVLRIGGTDTNIQPWLFDLYEFKKLKTLSLFDHPILKYVILNPYHTNLAIDCTNNHLLSKIFNISKLVKTKNCPYLEDKYIGLQNVFSHERNSDGKLIDICYQVKNYSFDYAKIKKEILNDLNMSSEDNEDTSLEDNEDTSLEDNEDTSLEDNEDTSLEDNEDTSSKNQDNNFKISRFGTLNINFIYLKFYYQVVQMRKLILQFVLNYITKSIEELSESENKIKLSIKL